MISDSRLFNTPLTTTIDNLSQWGLEMMRIIYQIISHYTDEVDPRKSLAEIDSTYTEGMNEAMTQKSNVNLVQVNMAKNAVQVRFEEIVGDNFQAAKLSDLKAVQKNLERTNPYRYNLLTLWEDPVKRRVIDAEVKRNFNKLGWSRDFIENNVLPVRPEDASKFITVSYRSPYLKVRGDMMRELAENNFHTTGSDRIIICTSTLEGMRSEAWKMALEAVDIDDPDHSEFWGNYGLINGILRDIYKHGCVGAEESY